MPRVFIHVCTRNYGNSFLSFELFWESQNFSFSTENSEEVRESLLCKHGRYVQFTWCSYWTSACLRLLLSIHIIIWLVIRSDGGIRLQHRELCAPLVGYLMFPFWSIIIGFFSQNGETFQKKVKQEYKGSTSHHLDDTPASTRQQASNPVDQDITRTLIGHSQTHIYKLIKL